MRKSLFFCLLLLAAATLSAQPYLTGHLFIDSVQGSMIQMHLEITNIGNQPFDYTFPDSGMILYSIDGIIVPYAYLPILLPWTIAPNETQNFELQHFDPLSPGEHVIQAYLNIDQGSGPLAIGGPQNVYIGWPFVDVTAGTGDLLNRVPVDFFWRTTLYECLFTPEDLDNAEGYVRSLTFYINFGQTFYSQHLKIYLGSSSQSDLSAGWTDANNLLPVFDGYVTFPIGEHAVEIPLTQEFGYWGGNLALRVFRPIHSSYQYGADPFLAQACDSLRVRKAFSDYLTYDPLAPPAPQPSQHVGFMPQTSFRVYPGVESDDELQTPVTPAVSCHPNPLRSGSALNVKSAQPFDRCEIFNLRGQKVLSQSFSTPQLQAQLTPALAPGLFFLRLSSAQGVSGLTRFVVVN